MNDASRRAAASPRALLLAIALFVASVGLSLRLQLWHGFIDLQVYRVGAEVWLDGGALYGRMPKVLGIGLPFTYPPLAAVFFTPLAVMPLWLAEVMITVTSVGCLALTLWLVLARLRPELDTATRLTLVTAAVAVLQLFEPLRQTFGFGQINLVLMAAVAMDCLAVRTRWPRGALIGVAAVVKLIPVAFLLYFLLRKDWKAAATTVATIAAAVLGGFLFFPRESSQYWFHTIKNTNRIGTPHFAGNQSIKGMAFRLGLPASTVTVVWLGLSLVVFVLAALWMRKLFATGGGAAHVSALLVNAGVVLLVSPVSWSHHWVWVAPALLLALDRLVRGKRGPWQLAAVAVFATMFLVGPQWRLPHGGRQRELGWSWWEQIVGNGYVLGALALLVVGVGTAYRARLDFRPAVRRLPPARPDRSAPVA